MRKKTVTNPNKVRLFVLANVAVLFFLVVAFGREYVGNLQIDQEIQQLEAEKVRLEDERLSTLNLIEELSSEEYLEREARTKHGLAKDGETLVLIQDDRPIGSLDMEEEIGNELPASNPMKWFLYFFDRDTFDQLRT